jgi:MurNAc alpha-1-phosphate uridylyltransferase
MVMVPNPAYHPNGDFALRAGQLALGGARLTFGNNALYRTSLFRELPPGKKFKILPLYQDWIGRGWASGEIHTGPWANVGSPDELVRLDRLLEGDAHLRP